MLMIKSAEAVQIKEPPPHPSPAPHPHYPPPSPPKHLPPIPVPDPVDTARDELQSLFEATNVSFPLSPERNREQGKAFKWSKGRSSSADYVRAQIHVQLYAQPRTETHARAHMHTLSQYPKQNY